MAPPQTGYPELQRMQNFCGVLPSLKRNLAKVRAGLKRNCSGDGFLFSKMFFQHFLVGPRCFNHETKGSYGANAVLQALSRCRDLEDLSLAYCCQIPTIAWWNLRDVQWSRLKKATFKSSLGKENEGLWDGMKISVRKEQAAGENRNMMKYDIVGL